jgi:hypothetical protein
VNDELTKIWKEALWPNFKVLSLHSPRKTKENHEKLRRNSRSPGRDLNPEPPEYETGVLTT